MNKYDQLARDVIALNTADAVTVATKRSVPAGENSCPSTGYLAHWRYSDGSASGVLPRVLSGSDVELLKLTAEHFGFEKNIEYIQVR